MLLSVALLAVASAAGFYAGLDRGEELAAPPVPRERPREDGAGDPIAATLSDEARQRTAGKKIEGLTRPARLQALPPEEVAVVLGVKPGMTVVDVGAGAGYFTFAFLEAMRGRGQLFATDVDPRVLAHIDRRAAGLGYDNVTTVKVGRLGVDPFYGEHVFDLIFLSSVLEYLPDPVAFFRGLRPSLRPGTGRLAIVQGLPVEGYHSGQFGEAFLHRRFLDQGPAFPPLRRLPVALRAALRGLRPGRILAAAQRRQMAAAVAAMLGDPGFFSEMRAHHARRTGDASGILRHVKPGDALLARWLVFHLGGAGVMGSGAPGDPLGRAATATLGAMALWPWFDHEKLGGDFHFPRALYLSNASVIHRMREAGYRLEREIDRFRGHAFVVFSGAAGGGARRGEGDVSGPAPPTGAAPAAGP